MSLPHSHFPRLICSVGSVTISHTQLAPFLKRAFGARFLNRGVAPTTARAAPTKGKERDAVGQARTGKAEEKSGRHEPPATVNRPAEGDQQRGGTERGALIPSPFFELVRV